MTLFRRKSTKSDVHTEFHCTVRFLDDSEPLQLPFRKETLGQVLFDQVCSKLNLLEKDYFGLRYVDTEKQRHWLDPLKSVYRQLKGVNPSVLCFRVKFYPEDPMKLHEEITRYYLFLQLRRDLHHGRLLCSPTDANLLAAYIIQSEVGEYDPEDHPPGYVAEFKMLPKQNAKMEEQIMEIHKTLGSQVPSEAEMEFLKKASTLDTYGVDPHQVRDQKGTQLYLGVTHQGIMTFHGSRRTQLYKWNQIRRVVYEGKMFIVHVSVTEDEDASSNKKKQQPMGYKCLTNSACKYLWRCAVEQQLFFTLNNSEHPPKMRSGGSLFSRGSKFRFSGRCQNEAYVASDTINRDEPEFNRTSSLPNFARKGDSLNRSAMRNSSLMSEPLKEDKYKRRYNDESMLNNDMQSKADTESAVDVPPSAVVAQGPVIKVPDGNPQEVVVETLQPQQSASVESPPKENGRIPAAQDESFNASMLYEPEQTLIDDEDDKSPKLSLDDQIRELEQQWDKIKSDQVNHVPSATPAVEETVMPAKSNKVDAASTNAITTPAQAPKKTRGICCRVCRILMFTFFFVFLTLTVTAIVVLYMDIQHPLVTELRLQLQVIEPVRDYINERVQSVLQ